MSEDSSASSPDNREQLKDRIANGADSVLWTHKAHFKAADCYRDIEAALNIGIMVISSILTISLLWGSVPENVLISLAILTAVGSGVKVAVRPNTKSRENYRAGNLYLRLLDEFKDFILIDFKSGSMTNEQLRKRYEELESRRRDLNDQMPNFRSHWYERLDAESVYSEVETTDETIDYFFNGRRGEEVEEE